MRLPVRNKEACCWDLVALGEVMLRFDPGERRIWTTRRFEVSEGGGEYNVARALKRCFGLNTAIVTAFVDNPVGRLLQDLIYQGGVDQSLIRWATDDGVGRAARNGLNFVERGYGVRPPLGCSDRGHTAVSQLKPCEIDWDEIFGRQGARWFHTGGIFCALSESTPEVALEAVQAARKHGTIVSYDLNYRDSLWKSSGGKTRAQEVNSRLAPYVDVLFGNEEDFSAALGVEVEGQDEHFSTIEVEAYKRVLAVAAKKFNSTVVAITLRKASTASRNDWGAICYDSGEFFESTYRKDLEILDRVGGGDSFASGLIYGYLSDHDAKWAVECGAAHAALAMTTPGDTSMATLNEVLRLMQGAGARIAR
jgi:2-dehydro-3-deoxygluconokinase